MTATKTTHEATVAAPAAPRAISPAAAALLLSIKGALILAAVYATALAITLLVPEEGDYALAARLQHRQLAMETPRKIALIGGSNLAFGVDSATIEATTGCHVANMGMNGYLGIRFMVAQAEANMNPGDIVVLAFEYDAIFYPVDGDSGAQLAVAKAAPVTLNYLTWRQRLAVSMKIPEAAHSKIVRLMSNAYDRVTDPAVLAPSLIRQIESVSGVTRHGDLVSHLGVDWPYDVEDGDDLSATPLDPEVIEVLQGFAMRMQERGVHVIMSYTPVMRSYYERHQASIDRFGELIDQAPPLAAPSAPRDYIYDEPYFFDTVYHLNAEGRAMRTERLLADLRRELGEDVQCGPRAGASNSGGIADD